MNKKLIEVHNLAFKLMDEFDLLDDGWGFKFNNRKNSLGCCTRTRYDGNYIQLSKYWVMELLVRLLKKETFRKPNFFLKILLKSLAKIFMLRYNLIIRQKQTPSS